MSIRGERIGEQIRQTLSRLLRDEVSDPRIGMLSLTRVEVAPDLSSAGVYWSPLVPPEGAEAAGGLERMSDGLASAAGFLRRRLAAELSLRRTPELLFRHDPSIERGAQVLELLREVNASGEGAATSDAEERD